MGDKEKRPKARDLMKKLMGRYYEEAKHAKDLGKYIVYTTAVSPVELFYAHDFIPIYPENHSVMCITSRLSLDLSRATEELGYDTDLCAYAKCDLGYRKLGKSPIGGIPDPDLLLACNAQCFTLTKWFEVLSRRYNVPLIVFDTPLFMEEAKENIIQYTMAQIRETIKELEYISGKKFDYDRLREVIKYSQEACKLYKQFLDLAAYKPSPISIFDTLIHMAVNVTLRGTKEAVDYYKLLLNEYMEEKVKKGIGVIPNEKYRLYWENLPIWFKFREHFNLLAEYGAVILTSLYTQAWCYDFNPDDPIRTLAENYASVFSNRPLRIRAKMALKLFREYSLNGWILFINRSCKAVSAGVYELKRMFVEETGIPALVFESDMGDPRFYSEVQVRTRIEAYLETLDRMAA